MLAFLLIAALPQQTLTAAALRPLVLAAAGLELDANTEVKDVFGLSTVHVPHGDVSIDVVTLAVHKNGRVPARVSIHAGGETRDLSAILLLAAQHSAFVLKHAMTAGSMLTVDDIVAKNVPEENGLADNALGTRLVRAKAAGEPLKRWDLAKVCVIQRSARLTLVARSGGVSAAAPAEARESGAVGDLIHVLNTINNSVVIARVVSANEVEVIQ